LVKENDKRPTGGSDENCSRKMARVRPLQILRIRRTKGKRGGHDRGGE